MVFDDQTQAGVTIAADLSKQLITISTGILALSITFAKDIAKDIGRDGRIIGTAWFLFLMTIVLALLHISALTGALLPTKPEYNLNFGSARFFAIGQIVVFAFAIASTVVFGLRAMKRLGRPKLPTEPPLNPS